MTQRLDPNLLSNAARLRMGLPPVGLRDSSGRPIKVLPPRGAPEPAQLPLPEPPRD
jgi:hypothetical protein